jgi:hypothetical protein
MVNQKTHSKIINNDNDNNNKDEYLQYIKPDKDT